MRRTPNPAGLIACGMAATLALVLASSADSSDKVKLEQTLSEVFKAGPNPRVVVETFNGSITVVGSDGDNVEAAVTKRGEGPDESVARHCLANIDVSLRQEGEVIYVTARLEHSTRRGHAQASVTIRVPSRAAVELETDNGPVRIRDLRHTVTTRVANGKIEVRGGSGLRVDLTTTNGDVEISGASGATVTRAESANGSVRFHGSLGDGSHSFHSGNGGIELVLPASSSFVIDAVSGNGLATSDFGVVESRGRHRGRLSGIVGDQPRTDIKARTTNGSIRILRGTAED
jgi:DUF4097 and DUF4098 domain-containing protein YvlB